jgi:tripartite ATP-independent transporter DctP family solute receptor
MLKRLLSGVLCFVVTVSVLAGCSKASVEDTNKAAVKPMLFRLAENQPEDYPSTIGDREFARLVSERTNGRIKIEVYSNGLLGSEDSVVEQIQFGAIDFARVSVSSLTEVSKPMVALMLPYLYRDREHMFKVLDGSIGDSILADLTNSGFIGLSWYDAGTRNFYNTNKEIKSPEDMIGLKIRTQRTELMMDLISAFGALPVAMSYADVYSALKTGIVDGAENNWPSFEASKHYEVSKFFTVDEHIRIPELILVSKMVMDKLSPEDQEIVKNAANEAALLERKEWIKREETSKKKLEASGVKITYLQTNAEFQEKVKGLYDKYGKEYKVVIDEILNTK